MNIAIHHHRVVKGMGSWSGKFINAPNGSYRVIKIVEGKEEIATLPSISRGRPLARILTLDMGVLALIEPNHV